MTDTIKDQKIKKLEELVTRLNRLCEYVHKNQYSDEGFEEVMDVKISRIKQLESDLSTLSSQLEEKGESELIDKIKINVDTIRANYDLWRNGKIKDGAFGFHLHNRLLAIDRLVLSSVPQSPELREEKTMIVAYIAHPIGGNVQGNLKKISDIARQINLTEPFTIPFAHYFFDCYSLNDDVPEERERGIRNDIALMGMGFIDEIRLYGDRISKGMKNEIWMAEKFNIPVTPMTPQTAKEYDDYLNSKSGK